MRELRGADVAALLDKEILNEGNPSVSFISAFAA